MMAGKVCLCISVLILASMVNSNLIVETGSGKVKGVEVASILKDEKFYSFMGIPYGQAPVDELRFKAPQQHPNWNDVLDATKEKPHCAQFNLPIKTIKKYGFCGQEDCLHLSIHTPKLPTDQEVNMPVIVFLYNEQFKITHNGTKDYGPDFFMKEDVILVTISYRVGSFGFLSYEDDLLPGNNGIKDVILALKWIQTNIHKFGGNNFKITLMGNDGGAALVDILLHSQKARGLFSGAILQSGTSWSSIYFNEKEKGRERAKALAKELQILDASSNLLLKDLNRQPAIKISESELQSLHADEARIIQMSILPFSPVVEHAHPDAVITRRPEDGPIDINVPVMIGYNTREGMEMCERFLRKPQYLTLADRDFTLMLPIRVNYRFELNNNPIRQAIDEIKEFYFDEGYVKISRPGEFITYIGDTVSFYPIDYTVRKYTNETITPIYYYTFDYSGELNMRKKKILEEAYTMEGTWGAAMGDELCYLFVCKPIKKEYRKALEDPDNEDLKVLKNMVRLWANFAKTGNPTPPGEAFTWTPATKENKECLVISDNLEIKTNLHEDKIKFWDKFLAKYQESAVNGVLKDDKDEL